MKQVLTSWDGDVCEEPSQEMVLGVFAELAGSGSHSNHDMSLRGSQQDDLMIVSFDPVSRRYCVSTSLHGDRDHMELFDPVRPHARVDAVVGGQMIDYWQDSLVENEPAKTALLRFFLHGDRHPDLHWRIAQL
jgi:hypothetical protein